MHQLSNTYYVLKVPRCVLVHGYSGAKQVVHHVVDISTHLNFQDSLLNWVISRTNCATDLGRARVSEFLA